MSKFRFVGERYRIAPKEQIKTEEIISNRMEIEYSSAVKYPAQNFPVRKPKNKKNKRETKKQAQQRRARNLIRFEKRLMRDKV